MEELKIAVKLKGEVANLAERLIKRGYSTTKADLVKDSIIFYGMQLGLTSPRRLHKTVLGKIKYSGKKFSDEEIKEQIRKIKQK